MKLHFKIPQGLKESVNQCRCLYCEVKNLAESDYEKTGRQQIASVKEIRQIKFKYLIIFISLRIRIQKEGL